MITLSEDVYYSNGHLRLVLNNDSLNQPFIIKVIDKASNFELTRTNATFSGDYVKSIELTLNTDQEVIIQVSTLEDTIMMEEVYKVENGVANKFDFTVSEMEPVTTSSTTVAEPVELDETSDTMYFTSVLAVSSVFICCAIILLHTRLKRFRRN